MCFVSFFRTLAVNFVSDFVLMLLFFCSSVCVVGVGRVERGGGENNPHHSESSEIMVSEEDKTEIEIIRMRMGSVCVKGIRVGWVGERGRRGAR